MKCYYEVLGIERTATDEEIKKAYKKLALKWHPDKNTDNEEVAKENFQLVQQAYEVLIDPHERTWYDNHREAILKGDDYKDDSLNILPFFSASCYKGFGDDPNGFYSTYREVFSKLAAEDSEYMREDEPEIPGFGESTSSYEEVVAPFYSYWMYYSTKKSYYWLDPHDIRQAPNNKIAKLIEKENKKIRDKAKKERNEEIRNLVAFVRKRDKRVQAWNEFLQEKARENKKKSEENRLQKLQERKSQMENYKESDWVKFANVEHDLKQIEEQITKEFGDSDSSKEDDHFTESKMNASLFCVACNKLFKTEKSFANHEKSKKHKENVQSLKEIIISEDNCLNLTPSEESSQPSKVLDLSNENDSTDNNTKITNLGKNIIKKKKSKQKKVISNQYEIYSSDTDNSVDDLDNIALFQCRKSTNKSFYQSDEETEKKLKKSHKKQVKNTEKVENKQEEEVVSNTVNSHVSKVELENEETKPIQKNKNKEKQKIINEKKIDTDLTCAECKSQFPSKNKLFIHLKSAGHSVYLPNSATAQKEKSSLKKKKIKKT